MNSITMNGVAMRGGELFHATREVTKMTDGTWRTTKFNDTLLETIESAKRDTYEPEPAIRKKLTDRELSELAGKYDPRNMTQNQYDAFLDELVEKGVLTRGDTTWLGHHGLVRLDVDMDELAEQLETGKLSAGGPVTVASVGNGNELFRSLEEADGDLIRFLQSMMAQRDQWDGPSTRERQEALDALYDVVRRM